MKKTIVSLGVIAVLLFSLAAPFSAAAINLSSEIDSVLNYYSSRQTVIENWDEIVAFASVNAVKGSDLKEPELDENEPVTLAQFIFSRLALGIKPSDASSVGDPVALLASKQKDDGSFYENDLFSDVLCATALEGARTAAGGDGTVYSAKQAVRHILSAQNENGAFAPDMKTHAFCMTYLSAFTENNAEVTQALDKAAKYIAEEYKNAEAVGEASTEEVAYATAALVDAGKAKTLEEFASYGDLPSVLVSRKNADGTYRASSEEGEGVKSAAVAAITAYDAISDGKSVWRSFTDYGGVNESMWEKLKWVALGFGVLVLLSVIFWLYILFGRKKYRDDESGAVGQ